MKKLLLFLVFLMLITSLSFAGGRRGADAAPLIGIAMPETHVERWISDGNNLRAEADRRGYRAEVQWADANQALQNTQIQSFLVQGARAIIVGNINEGVVPVIHEARRDGVYIIAYDRIIQGTHDYDYFVTFNNYQVGQMQAQSLVNGLNLAAATPANPRNITLFAGSPVDANAFFFFDGAMGILLPYIDRGVLNVVGPFPRSSADTAAFMQIATDGWQAPIAGRRMDDLLAGAARDVHLHAVLSPNDTLARAIITSLQRDARYINNMPLVSGQDAEFDSMIMIRDGLQHSTVFKDTAQLANLAMTLADQLIRGVPRSFPGASLATGPLAAMGYTGTGNVRTFLLDPVLITRDNIHVPGEAGFFTEAQAAQLRR